MAHLPSFDGLGQTTCVTWQKAADASGAACSWPEPGVGRASGSSSYLVAVVYGARAKRRVTGVVGG